ncbi:L-2-hydroxyglutarate oxidase [Salsuginibacillus kocurii]|uniref:L-2-hydroxyglutarate oxidase n=1 Tax=Salsuginibacillus kocurii TaxID=427078 RepID=UPI000364BA9B|nr:L-2-hydroxyglutarate oxidase [Salsuginibacillus kocurii]
MYDVIIVGTGIIGLATAREWLKNHPADQLLLIDKEADISTHQTGRNSGVIHSGLYYKPGSQKAKFAVAGNKSMKAYCKEHQLPLHEKGKVIAATTSEERKRLEILYEQGKCNQVPVKWLKGKDLMEQEPHVAAIAAIYVPTVAVTDFKKVTYQLRQDIENAGGTIYYHTEVKTVNEQRAKVEVVTNNGTFTAASLINCAGLWSDTLVKKSGIRSDVSIIPFKGEYFKIKEDKAHLIRHSVYPVPDPAFPFLGVHFTRSIDNEVHVGPNAVWALNKERYTKTDGIDVKEMFSTLNSSAFFKLAAAHGKTGVDEFSRSLSKNRFVRMAQKLIPDLTADDLIPAEAGIRAQAVHADGHLVDDFLMFSTSRCVHVVNAPSPAATAALEIGKAIHAKVRERHNRS